MSDGGFLNERPLETPVSVPPEAAPSPVEEGEDDVAMAERQAAAQMQEEERKEAFLTEGAETSVVPPVVVSATPSEGATPPTSAPIQKDEVLMEVEKILGQGLADYYKQMPEPAQLRFRQKGVEVAIQISGMIRTLHLKAKRVLALIHDWLLTIPGVNKFFLEQESKIKTDRVVELERLRREEAQKQP